MPGKMSGYRPGIPASQPYTKWDTDKDEVEVDYKRLNPKRGSWFSGRKGCVLKVRPHKIEIRFGFQFFFLDLYARVRKQNTKKNTGIIYTVLLKLEILKCWSVYRCAVYRCTEPTLQPTAVHFQSAAILAVIIILANVAIVAI